MSGPWEVRTLNPHSANVVLSQLELMAHMAATPGFEPKTLLRCTLWFSSAEETVRTIEYRNHSFNCQWRELPVCPIRKEFLYRDHLLFLYLLCINYNITFKKSQVFHFLSFRFELSLYLLCIYYNITFKESQAFHFLRLLEKNFYFLFSFSIFIIT